MILGKVLSDQNKRLFADCFEIKTQPFIWIYVISKSLQKHISQTFLNNRFEN